MSKKHVFIHIGSDKAGSTAIQAFAFKNTAWLAERGLHVVSSRHRHHGRILHEIKQGSDLALAAAVDEIRGHDAPKHLLTFEGFYHLEGRPLQTLVQAFQGMAVHVLYYVRRRSDRFRSGFAQNLKMGDAARGAHACRLLFDGGFADDAKYLDYAAVVRRWQKALKRAGSDHRFELAVYEPSSFRRGSLVLDFLSRLGVLQADEPVDGPPFSDATAVVNPSLTPAAQYLMVLTQAVGLDDRRRRVVRELLAGAPEAAATRGSLVPDELAAQWDRRYLVEDNELAREFLGRDTLFLDDAQFSYRTPQGQEFIDLIEVLYRGRERLAADAQPDSAAPGPAQA